MFLDQDTHWRRARTCSIVSLLRKPDDHKGSLAVSGEKILDCDSRGFRNAERSEEDDENSMAGITRVA
jgi:hypothetical protein